MKTTFKELDLQNYLEKKRARVADCEEVTGLQFKNERQEVVQRFVDRINKDREGSKYKAVTWSQINGQLRYFKDLSDLKRFYRQCSDSNCFSAIFWWKLKQLRSPQG